MKTTLFALATLVIGNAALAIPLPTHPVVSPSEKMVTVPGLEYMGASRVSSVQFCVSQTGAKDWRHLITDSDLQNVELCLRDLT